MRGLDQLYRRLLMAVGRGETRTVDDSKFAQVLQIFFGPLETRDNTPRIAEYGFTSNPPSGTDAVVVFVGGDRDNGVVIATNNKKARLKNLAAGEVAIHDDQGRWIWLKRGSIEIEAGNTPININHATVVTVNASTKVELVTPLLKVDGDIQASGNVSDAVRSMAADRAKYNAHKHSGVTAGGASTGTTDTPE